VKSRRSRRAPHTLLALARTHQGVLPPGHVARAPAPANVSPTPSFSGQKSPALCAMSPIHRIPQYSPNIRLTPISIITRKFKKIKHIITVLCIWRKYERILIRVDGTILRLFSTDINAEVWTVDIWLAVVIGITQLLLGGMGVYVSLRPPKAEHHWYWLGGFVAVGLTGVVLTGWLASVGSREQKRNASVQERLEKNVEDTNQKLQASLVEQARMSGHLEGIQTIMDNLSKSGLPGMREFADAIAKLAKQSTGQTPKLPLDVLCQNLADCPSKELGKRANELASEIDNLTVPFFTAFAKWTKQCNDAGFGTPDYQKCLEARGSELRGLNGLAMTKYHDRYQNSAMTMRTVLVKRSGEYSAFDDSDYNFAAIDSGDVWALQRIVKNLRTLASKVLLMRQYE